MATVSRKSLAITNRDATPRVINAPANSARELKEVIGYIAAAADDSGTSLYRVVTVPSNARISEILLTCADFSSAGKIDIGVHRTTQDGGAAVDADLFCSAFALTDGPYSNIDLVREAGTSGWTLADAEKALWQALGLSVDPGIEYDITVTVETTFSGGSGLLFKVRYV